MTRALFDPIAPGSTHQLGGLLVAVAAAALLALLVSGGLWAWRRWRAGGADRVRPVFSGDVTISGDGEDRPAASSLTPRPIARLLGVVLLLALLLPVTVAVRQIWPHPDLGWRLLAIWLLVLLVPTVTWLATRAGDHLRGPRS